MNLVILQSKNQQVKNVCHMIIQDKITEIFCVADEFSKVFDVEFSKRSLGKAKRNRKATLTDVEIMLLVFGSK